jgi:hypothetical protein
MKSINYICIKLKVMDFKYPIIGTFEEIKNKVPTKAVKMMISANRKESHIFTVDVQYGFLLVW